MLPLDVAPPLIPDKETLDLILGPYGATIVLVFACSLLLWAAYRLFSNLMLAHAANAELHKEYTERLNAAHETQTARLLEIVKEAAKRDADGIIAARDLATSVKMMLRPGP